LLELDTIQGPGRVVGDFPARTSYIDSIEIMGTVYTIEPGGTGPAISLSSPFVDLGYTEDGVTLTYNADESDIEVEEKP